MKAHNIEEAWTIANGIIPADYEKDEAASERAGYGIYRCYAEGFESNYICDLGDRLEVNTADGKSINIWIDTFENEQQTAEQKDLAVFGKKASHFDIETWREIKLCVENYISTNYAERRLYSRLVKAEAEGKGFMASVIYDIIDAYCKAHNINYGIMSHPESFKFENKEGYGHFVISAMIQYR